MPSAQSKTRNAGKKGTVERIISVAAAIFSENGYEGTSVRMICTKAKVNLCSINYHFGSKEKLYFEVFRYVYNQHSKEDQWLFEAPAPIASLDEWEQRLTDSILKLLKMGMAKDKLSQCRCRLTALEMAHPSKCLPLLLDTFYQPVKQYFINFFKLAVPEFDETRLLIIVTSIMNQIMGFVRIVPPWDHLCCPPGMTLQEWIVQAVRNLVRLTRIAIEQEKQEQNVTV